MLQSAFHRIIQEHRHKRKEALSYKNLLTFFITLFTGIITVWSNYSFFNSVLIAVVYVWAVCIYHLFIHTFDTCTQYMHVLVIFYRVNQPRPSLATRSPTVHLLREFSSTCSYCRVFRTYICVKPSMLVSWTPSRYIGFNSVQMLTVVFSRSCSTSMQERLLRERKRKWKTLLEEYMYVFHYSKIIQKSI